MKKVSLAFIGLYLGLFALMLFIVLTGLARAADAPGIHTVDARVVGMATKPGDSQRVILFQTMQSGCPDGAKRFVYLNQTAHEVWLGCWIKVSEGVGIVYEDGDSGMVPESEIVWLTKPAKDDGKKNENGERAS